MTAVEWLMDKLPKSIETQFSKQIEQAKEMEKESQDDFAIEFAEFQSRFLTKPVEGRFYCYYNSQWITTKQLLEIYKQEKGL